MVDERAASEDGGEVAAAQAAEGIEAMTENDGGDVRLIEPHPATETSLEAWREIEGKVVQATHRAICAWLATRERDESFSSSEIGFAIGMPRDSISPRMRELVDLDLVEVASVSACSVTNRRVKQFRLTGRPPREKPTKIKRADLGAQMVDGFVEGFKVAGYFGPVMIAIEGFRDDLRKAGVIS